MIDIQCSGCGKRYRVPETFGGKRTRCKQCSAVIDIPVPAAPPIADPFPLAESAPEPPPPPPAESEPSPAEGPTKRARKPMKLPARGGAGGGAKKPLARAPLHARKPLGKSAEAKPAAARRARPAAGEEEGAHEVVGEKGGQRTKAFLVGGILLMVLLGCAAGWYFLAGPGAAPATPVSKTSKKAVTAKDAGEGTKSADVKAAGTDEEAPKIARVPGAPLDSLSVIPKDVHFIGQIAVGQIANIPGVREGLQKGIESSGMKEFLADAELDPTGQIARAWIAGQIPASGGKAGAGGPGPDGPEDVVIVIEGTFDRRKLVDALEKHSLVAKDVKKAGDHAVYELVQKDGQAPRLVLPADDQLILGSGHTFDGALELLAGKGSSVRENAALKAHAKDFEPTTMAWAAFQVPPGSRGPTESKVEGGFLSIDRSPDGDLDLAMHADCASPEEAARAKQEVAGAVLSIPPQFVPPPIQDALKELKVEAEGKALSVTLQIPAKVLEALSAEETQAAAGEGEGDAPEEEGKAEEAEPGGKGDAEMKEKEGEASEAEPETEAKGEEPEEETKAEPAEEGAESEPAEEPEEETKEKP